MALTLSLTVAQVKIVIEKFKQYEMTSLNNYITFRANYKSSFINVYTTNTVLVQGKNCLEVYNELCYIVDLEQITIPERNVKNALELSVIGSDEVGTGDFFGAIVVASTFVPVNKFSLMQKLGIKDSKLLTDEKIQEIAPILMKEVIYSYLVLDNLKFNYITQIKKYNMNKIKALMHNNVVGNILKKVTDYDAIVIDAFTTEEKYFEYLATEANINRNVKLYEKAEAKYISVAASSVIARYIFLQNMCELSEISGFELPKGAGDKVDLAARKIIMEKGTKFLNKIAKTNFKNYERVTARQDF